MFYTDPKLYILGAFYNMSVTSHKAADKASHARRKQHVTAFLLLFTPEFNEDSNVLVLLCLCKL